MDLLFEGVLTRSHIRYVRLYPLAIPLRKPFRHAHARSGRWPTPLVVEVELADGTCGYGETLPRPYVSGETIESVVRVIREELPGELVGFHPESFPPGAGSHSTACRIAIVPAGIMTGRPRRSRTGLAGRVQQVLRPTHQRGGRMVGSAQPGPAG